MLIGSVFLRLWQARLTEMGGAGGRRLGATRPHGRSAVNAVQAVACGGRGPNKKALSPSASCCSGRSMRSFKAMLILLHGRNVKQTPEMFSGTGSRYQAFIRWAGTGRSCHGLEETAFKLLWTTSISHHLRNQGEALTS